MTHQSVRTRFAPSPTGSLHVGGLRTALFTWMQAKHHHGKFILRIEDTDQKRFDPTALQTLMDALRWAGLDWDEGPEADGAYGPYIQSERLATYQHWANWLVEHGHAYRCFCTPERLEQVNREKQERKESPGYDRHCRSLTPAEIAALQASGTSCVIRFKAPLEGQTTVRDLIRGETVFENHTIQDAVLLKSDGYPTYHLAVVIDDYLMQITHVTRAVEWYPSYPLHTLIWQAFGWQMPEFAHLPVMLNPNGKGKMSKRNPPRDQHGNIIPVMVHDYMKAGYLPEAMVNFLANIGWNYGDNQEIFSIEEAIARFDLKDVNEANSAYPVEKLDWINGHYMRELTVDDLARRLRPFFEEAGLQVDQERLLKLVPIIQIRIKTLAEAVPMAGFVFADWAQFEAPAADMLIPKKMDAAATITMLEASLARLEGLEDFSHETQHEACKTLTEELNLKNSQVFGALRAAVTGQQVSPPTFETMEILGKAESLRRIRLAIQRLRQTEA